MNVARRARPPRLDEGAVISLRLAATGDEAALEQLAQLSGGVKSQGPWIVAEVDDQLWAALPLAGGQPLVDPFRPTAELRALLSLRARQVGAKRASHATLRADFGCDSERRVHSQITAAGPGLTRRHA
jgi:hypothetical protein